MKRPGLFGHIFVPLVVPLVAALALATWEVSRFLERFHRDEVSAELESGARVFAEQFADILGDSARVDARCKELGELADRRITVILPGGRVVGDSVEDPARMDNHAHRSEVLSATAGEVGRSARYSSTLQADFLYVAEPVLRSGEVVGVVRVGRSLASIDRALHDVYTQIGVATSLVAIFGTLTSLGVARRVTRPLQRMRMGADRFAQGNLENRLATPRSAELAELAIAMNRMAEQLSERIEVVHRQRDELRTILASMNEGVIAVDDGERIVSVNRAAAALFGVEIEAARGRPIEEVVRSPKLQQCIKRTLTTTHAIEEEVVLGGANEHTLRVITTVLRNQDERAVGALMVLDDVTQLRRSERARSEFVANVSHEIRTPVTSIKGYAETLLNDPPEDAEIAQRFLAIIVQQSDRLASLVDDILSLGSIERSAATGEITFEHVPLLGVLNSAVSTCSPKASEKRLGISVTCNESISVKGQAALLEQAIVNLVDNAIKYSPEGSNIEVAAGDDSGGIAIRVRDYGTGIAAEHLSRIFERFYRVDRARSRTLGGTGLGLSIVKHIVQLHGGQVSVDSALGKGSCFSLRFPSP
ncbi:MAG TPA: ATP-binding protein [Candidatus Hydrogenedentes bacterium]|nr:ATP-binding protein [Candidatus Hydrogenedentota bacterium]HPG66942.1 ATP-binding protein [Candidatus Hydrogenedentota bacterium]